MWFQKPPLGTPLDWGNPLNKGVVFAPAMNEGHGDKVQDLSLNGNHGTLNNFAFPPTVDSGWNPGQTGIGLKFDGTNNHINFGDSVYSRISGATTISGLINVSDTATTKPFMSLGYDSGTKKGIYFRIAGDEGCKFYVGNGATLLYANTDAPLPTDTWINLVGWYDGTTVKIFLNGVEQSATATVTAPIQYTTPANLYFGKFSVAYFKGAIDQPRIMTRAWSAKEVRDYAINPWQVYLDE